MHEIPIPNPLLALASHFPLHALAIPRRDHVLAIMIDQVLDDQAGLGDHERLLQIRARDADDGRFAQRVDLLEFWVGQHFGGALVGFQVVGDVQLFQEPEDALRAGFFKPVMEKVEGLVSR